MKRAIIVLAMLIAATSYAAGAYDGKWVGGSQPTDACKGTMTIEMTIVDNAITGSVHSDTPTPEGYTSGKLIPGATIAPDGTANVLIGQNTRYPTAFRFAKEGFTANMNVPCGTRTITGKRSN